MGSEEVVHENMISPTSSYTFNIPSTQLMFCLRTSSTEEGICTKNDNIKENLLSSSNPTDFHLSSSSCSGNNNAALSTPSNSSNLSSSSSSSSVSISRSRKKRELFQQAMRNEFFSKEKAFLEENGLIPSVESFSLRNAEDTQKQNALFDAGRRNFHCYFNAPLDSMYQVPSNIHFIRFGFISFLYVKYFITNKTSSYSLSDQLKKVANEGKEESSLSDTQWKELYVLVNSMFRIPPSDRRFDHVYGNQTADSLRREWLEFLRDSWVVVFPYSNTFSSDPRELWFVGTSAGDRAFLNASPLFIEKLLSNALKYFFPKLVCEYVFHNLNSISFPQSVYETNVADRLIACATNVQCMIVRLPSFDGEKYQSLLLLLVECTY